MSTSVDSAPTKGGKVRGPYAKTAEVRQKIIEVCIEAFGASGFHGATMKDIAKRAGISQTGLMHHFPTKADLLIGVLQERARQETRVHIESGPIQLISSQSRVIADNSRRPGIIQLHSIISSEATAEDHPAHEIYRARYDYLRQKLTAEFAELEELGRLRVQVAPNILADLFVATLDGLQVQWLYNRTAVDIQRDFQAFLGAVIRED